MVVSTRKWEQINAENNTSTAVRVIAKNENNAENAQQKADGWPGRWNFFEPEFLGIGAIGVSTRFLVLVLVPTK